MSSAPRHSRRRRRAVFAGALVLLAPLASTPSSQKNDDERHERAKRLLAASAEKDVQEGTRLARELDDVAAVELLLDVLALEVGRGLPPAHYRDVVWDGLVGITDPYARLRVEQELEKSRSAWVRQWCAELLGGYGSPEFGRSLKRALRDKEEGVRRAAARSLGRIGDSAATDALAKLVDHKDEVLRANAIEALVRIDPDGHAPVLRDAVATDEDGGVRCALLAAAVACLPDETEALCTAALGDEDWRPRVEAAETLAGVRTKSAVDALIAAVADGRPVVAARAEASLVTLTGQHHVNAEAWRRWWADVRESFAFPTGAARSDARDDRSRATYYGIELQSDHVAFLIDRSEAMSEPLTSRGMSKDAAALEELAQVLGGLHGRLTFNVFAYDLDVEPFEKRAIELTEKTAKRALAFVRDTHISGRKDIWQVLEAVLDDPTIDTAYLLSSGEPDTGTYVHWNRVTLHLKERNRFRKLRIHAIAYSDNEWYRDQIQRIAESTGGEFRWFE